VSNRSKRNVLHLAALHASTEVMDILTTATLSGIDTIARDKDGHSPNQCFLECRSAHCAIARKPFHKEKESWVRLLASSCRHTTRSDNVDAEFGNLEIVVDKICYESEDSFLVTEDSSESDSEEEFVDAEDGRDKA
jgi:hypothetical protein